MSDDSIILGFDPGLQGAVAALRLDGVALWARPLPVRLLPPRGKRGRTLRLLDAEALARMLTLERDGIALAAVEEVGARPRDARRGAFAFGRGLGTIEGVLATLHFPVRLVRPQDWKAEVLGPRTTEEDWSKRVAVEYAFRRFPGVALVPPRCRNAHEGMAEALLICEWGRRRLAGEREGAA